jgi:hypothetical protein
MDSLTGMTWNKRPSWILLITGAVQLACSVIFFVLGSKYSIIRTTFYVTGALFVVVGILLIWLGLKAKGRYQETQRVKGVGLDGAGSIVSMRQTGLSMNEQPQVELTLSVQVAGRAPYQVTKKEFVPLMLLGTLTSGIPLPLKVDPADANDVVIDWEHAGSPPERADRRQPPDADRDDGHATRAEPVHGESRGRRPHRARRAVRRWCIPSRQDRSCRSIARHGRVGEAVGDVARAGDVSSAPGRGGGAPPIGKLCPT